MRVIEPHHFKQAKHKKAKRSRGSFALIIPAGLIAIILGYIMFGQQRVHSPKLAEQTQQKTEDEITLADKHTEPKLQEFTDEEFKQLYTTFAYPNTQPLIDYPIITGNKKADARIISLAEERGYKLSSVPVSSIVKIDEPYLTEDDLLQQNAKLGWDSLKQAAQKNDIPLQITSAYRSVEFQRSVFLRIMKDEGISAAGIADGYSDMALQRVMSRVAPPGFSRHHNGYTVDFACDGIGLYGFKNTRCYDWISKNNFEIAKSNGWVPSYPEEAELQGPEPEPWEFIWVGTVNLYE